MTCIHDAFVITIEELLDQYVVVEESQSFKLGQNVTKKIVYSKDQIVDNTEMFKDALTIDVIADAEFNIDLSKNDKKELLDDTVISREFDFSNNKNLSKDPIETNTEKMTQILNQFLINPYDIIIGEMAVELNKYNTDILDITIPIEFSINKGLVDQLLSDIPNDIIYNKNGNISMQLSNSNFTFDQSLITQLATMRYQIIPIYSFLDESENIQLLIIDTWEKKYKNLLIGGNDILYTNQYTPLYTIKSDSYNIYINLDINTSIVTYSFSVPYNTFGDYTKLIVDFMLEDELDQYLNVE